MRGQGGPPEIPEIMEKGSELTLHGPKWPNKAWKRILTPIQIQPCAAQPAASHMKIGQAISADPAKQGIRRVRSLPSFYIPTLYTYPVYTYSG